MKITFSQIALILFFTGMSYANPSKGQALLEQRVDFTIQNSSLKTALTQLEKQTNYRFVYRKSLVEKETQVYIDAKSEKIGDILTKLLLPRGIAFEVISNRIVLSKIKLETTDLSQGDDLLQAQTNLAHADQQAALKVSGIVTDVSTGETLVGATIRVKGANIVTSVDAAGKFTITVPDANSILVVNYVGYTEQEVQINGKTSLDIKLSKVTTNLDEVVVTGFGLTNKKATLSGAISTVNADELQHSRAVSTGGALVGKVAGVNFRQTTGRPGYAPDIQIRNFGALPLLVVDGVIRQDRADFATFPSAGSSFNNLDFNDIESISVLKDASAAIYGLLAVNGVIVVTTKKGKRGQKPTISYNGYYGSQAVTNFNKPMDVKTYIKGIVQTETYNNIADGSRTISRAEYDKWMNPTDLAHQGFDWFKYIYIPAPQNYNSINISGGSENIDYYVSAGNLIQHSMFRNFGSGFSRTNIQANINATITKRIKLGVSINGHRDVTNSAPSMSDDYDFPAEAAFRNIPTLRPFANENPLYPAVTSPSDPQYSYGIVNYGVTGSENTGRNAIQVNGNLEINLLPGLKARVLAGYGYTGGWDQRQRKSPSLYVYDASTDQYNLAPNLSQTRIVRHIVAETQNTSTNFQLEYKKSIGKHNFQANAGMETTSIFSPLIDLQSQPAANGISYIPTAAAVTIISDDISIKVVRQGYLGRFNYDYDGKYIAEFSARYDGSPYFAPDKRWGFFPGGSLAYRISQEGFWKRSSILSKINDFKLRASYGILGDELGVTGANYAQGYNYNSGTAVLDGNIIAADQARGLPSTYVTWGRAQTVNLGVDITLLNSRLSGTFEWFQRTRTGLLAARRDNYIPDLEGITIGNENLNSDINRGIEGSLNWRDHIGNVNYFVGGNFTFSRKTTGFRYKPLFSSDYARFRDPNNQTGRYQNTTFQYVSIGQFQSWQQIADYPIDQDSKGNTTLRPGDYIYKDTNGDGFITDLDKQNVSYNVNNANPPGSSGQGSPLINYGFNLGGSYKGFDIRADFAGASLFTYEQQGFMRSWTANQNTSQYLANNSTWYNDIWDKNSGFAIGKFPLLTQGSNSTNTYQSSTAWETNVTYVKLRNLEIGYTLPYSVMKSVGISNFRVYVSGQNIVSISNVPGGLDPEQALGGGNTYPNPRILTVGAQVKF